MSSVIINNIDFDILKIKKYEQSYNNMKIYGIPHISEIEIIAETSINNLSILENWNRKVNTTNIFRYNNQYMKFMGIYTTHYEIDFQSNSNSNNIVVTLSADYFQYVTDIRELRKLKLEKLNALTKLTKI